MRDYKLVFEYMNMQTPLGASKYAPLVLMINDDRKIVEELLNRNFEYFNNMWLFLDQALYKILNTTKHYEPEYIEIKIIRVLSTFAQLDEKTKYSINSEELAKLVLE